jgi:hypothetical protein
MRALLIDPEAKTIKEIQLVDGEAHLDHMQEIIGGNVDHIVLCDDDIAKVDVWVHDECLMNMEYGPMDPEQENLRVLLEEDNYTPQCVNNFWVLHSAQKDPMNLVNGKAIVTGFDQDGNTEELSRVVTAEMIKRVVSFVPKASSNSAAGLCEEILENNGTLLDSEDAVKELSTKHNGILARAMQLATIPAS